ncbi:hypothetical protein H8958_006984 [Nasalis larvatus]
MSIKQVLQKLVEIGHQRQKTPEGLQESANVKISGTFSDEWTVKLPEFQFSSQNKEYPNQEDCTTEKGKKTTVETEDSSVENPEEDLFVEQKERNSNVDSLKVINKVELEVQRQLIDTKREDQTAVSIKENASRGHLLTVPSAEAEGVLLVVDKDLFSVETPKKEHQPLRNTSFTCQNEQAHTLETEYIHDETGGSHIKPQSKKSEVQDDHKESQEAQNIAGGSMMMLEKTDEEDNGRETFLSYSHPSELLEEATLNVLSAQLLDGGIFHEQTGQKLLLNEAISRGIVPSHTAVKLMEKLNMFQGFFDSQTYESLTTEEVINEVVQSIDRGLLEREEAIRLLTKQVLDGGIIHHISGMRLSVDNAFRHGLIGEDLAKKLKRVEDLNIHQIFNPETKETVSLPKAIKLDLITPDLKREIQEVQAFTGNFVDLISGQRLTLAEAEKEGLLTNEAVLSPGMMHGIVDPENCRIVPYSELLKKCKIDIESGQRYLEVIPFSDIKDGVGNKVLTLSQAIQLGKVDFASTLKVLEAQANTGGIIDTATGKRLTLASALEEKLVDENMVRIIASHQALNGGIVDIFSDQRVTLAEAIEKRLISPELANMIQIDTSEFSDHRAQIEKQEGIEVCALQNESLRKDMLIACNQTAEMSCNKVEESERLLQVENQSAQEKVKARVSDREQAKKSREISLKEFGCKDQHKPRMSPDAKEFISIINPHNLKGKSLGQVSLTHTYSEVCDFKLKEVARNNMGNDTNEEQKKAVTKIEIISHMKQSPSCLDSEEIGENRGEVILEVQETYCETSGKLPSEQVLQQPMNAGVKSLQAGSIEDIVTQRGSRVLGSFLPEKLFKGVSQKENTGQQNAIISPTVPETSEEKTMSLTVCSTVKTEKTSQEKLRESPGIEQTPFMTALGGKGNGGLNPEPFRATQNVFTRQLCLEHDEKLVSYLSLLRNIEMRTRQIQPLELNLAELQDLLCQAKVLDRELKDLTTLVSQELECVNQIIISQPQEVPAPLLKALEKDAKNLQKSLSSVSDTWNSRLLHFQNAVEIEKVAFCFYS